jgi:hypothetical protein
MSPRAKKWIEITSFFFYKGELIALFPVILNVPPGVWILG